MDLSIIIIWMSPFFLVLGVSGRCISHRYFCRQAKQALLRDHIWRHPKAVKINFPTCAVEPACLQWHKYQMLHFESQGSLILNVNAHLHLKCMAKIDIITYMYVIFVLTNTLLILFPEKWQNFNDKIKTNIICSNFATRMSYFGQ